ncbi:hypothetical protein [Mesorhizobium sp. CO1-1-4]|uniref:hypothetical protein n=1 Tax=Mesorhizobium sp. CO1-1-4 TaxID=2876633 RepID=UPI001CCB63A4|nr:hypothetical protein [Mesorhizobium sp. CO1-1-4]MBZ9742347.1 hypothetical protein [Mesorhizobium sp. CO1-1-4]
MDHMTSAIAGEVTGFVLPTWAVLAIFFAAISGAYFVYCLSIAIIKNRFKDQEGLWPTILKNLWILILGLLMLSYSVILPDNGIWHHMFRDLGIALVVAFAIIITIEHRQREELNRYIFRFLNRTNQSMIESVLGIEFPAGMYDFIRSTVMKAEFFRTDSQINYTLYVENGKLVVEFISTHTIWNLTDHFKTYPCRFFVEKDPSRADADGIDYKHVELIVAGVRVSEEKLAAADKKLDDGDSKRFEYPIDMKPKERITFKLRYKLLDKMMSDTEVWRSVYSCDGANFIINYPSNLVVSVDALHSDGYELIHKTDTVICGRIRRPLLPHNGFMFWWRVKDGSTQPGQESNKADLASSVAKT